MKWNADLYDSKHSFVFQYGENVLELLNIQPGERILDLGCGTGYLAQQIKEHGASVKGIDASPEMVAKAHESYPEIDFAVADATDFYFDEQFDAVFSNATLHWIKNADAAIKCVYESLKPGGRFVAEMGGKGNMKHMIAATATILKNHSIELPASINPWYFPSLSEYTGKLEAQGFRVTFAAHFDRPTLLQDGRQGVGKWLKMFGPAFFQTVPEEKQEQILNEITDLLEPDYHKDGQWYADYVRLRFIAVKE